MTTKRTALLWGCVLMLAAVGLHAQVSLPAETAALALRPLVRLHSSGLGGAHGVRAFDEDVTVTSDGTVSVSAAGNDITAPIARGWLGYVDQAKGTPAQWAALRQTLLAAHAGLQSGRCSLRNCAAWSDSIAIAWYGQTATGRSARFTVELGTATAPPCSADQLAILMAIETYAQTVTGQHSEIPYGLICPFQ